MTGRESDLYSNTVTYINNVSVLLFLLVLGRGLFDTMTDVMYVCVTSDPISDFSLPVVF